MNGHIIVAYSCLLLCCFGSLASQHTAHTSHKYPFSSSTFVRFVLHVKCIHKKIYTAPSTDTYTWYIFVQSTDVSKKSISCPSTVLEDEWKLCIGFSARILSIAPNIQCVCVCLLLLLLHTLLSIDLIHVPHHSTASHVHVSETMWANVQYTHSQTRYSNSLCVCVCMCVHCIV